MVRAKFRVESKTEMAHGGFTIKMQPVTSGSAENKEFFKWTPGGSIDLTTINPEAASKFKPGEELYVDFTRAPEQPVREPHGTVGPN